MANVGRSTAVGASGVRMVSARCTAGRGGSGAGAPPPRPSGVGGAPAASSSRRTCSRVNASSSAATAARPSRRIPSPVRRRAPWRRRSSPGGRAWIAAFAGKTKTTMPNALLAHRLRVITGGAEPDAAVDGDGSTQVGARQRVELPAHVALDRRHAALGRRRARERLPGCCSLSDAIRPSGPSQAIYSHCCQCVFTPRPAGLFTLASWLSTSQFFFLLLGGCHATERLHLAQLLLACRPRRRLARAALRPRPPQRRGLRALAAPRGGAPRAAARGTGARMDAATGSYSV